MIAAASETDAWLAASAQLEKDRPAPAWLSGLRQGALQRFAQLGFPTTRQEAWRRTSVAAIARAPFRTAEAAVPRFRAADIDRFAFGDWPRAQLVFMDGRYRPELSSTGGLPAGAEVLPLSAALTARADLVRAHLARLTDGSGQARWIPNGFTALNTAFIEEGAFIHIPARTELPHPVHLLFISTGAERREEATVTHPRTLIVADEGAKAMVVESYLGDWHGIYLTNAVTEIHAGEGAVVDHCKLQRESGGAYHVGTIQAQVGRDGVFTSTSISLGAALARHDINVALAGTGASATLNGLYVVDGTQHVDHHTVLDHAAPACTSRELYKGVLGGSSRGVFDGAVIVRPGAAGTDSQQANRNVLISEDAMVDTKPQLEILADDVKCTHAATVGQIDENALFYLRSRGIDLDTARSLMIHAFVGEVIHRIGILPIRKGLDAQTFIRLPGPHDAGEVPS